MPDHHIASTSAVVFSEMAQQSQNIHPLYTVAGQNVNQTNNSRWNLPSGHIDAAQPQNSKWNIPSDYKRSPSTQVENSQWKHPSTDLGGWQVPSKDVNTTTVSVPSQNNSGGLQSKVSQSAVEDEFCDFSDFQSGTTNNIFVSSSAALLPVGGSSSSAAVTSQGFAIPSSVMPLRTGSVAATSAQSIASNLSDLAKMPQHPGKTTADDDFGAFQDSSLPTGTTLKELARQFSSLSSNSATSSISEESSATKTIAGNSHLDDLFFKDPSKEGTGIASTTSKSNISAPVPPVPKTAISINQSQNFVSAVTNETASDKYDIFRTLNFEQNESVFASKAIDDQSVISTPNTQVTNDNFGEFETFQRHEKSAGPVADDFGDFSNFEPQSSAKDLNDIFGNFTSSSQVTSSENLGEATKVEKESQPAVLGLGSNAFHSLENPHTNVTDFGSFSDSVTDKNKRSSTDIWNINSLDQKPVALSASSGNGNFAAFGSFTPVPTSEGSGNVKLKPITDIASVPLEPSQRYKALSAEFEV